MVDAASGTAREVSERFGGVEKSARQFVWLRSPEVLVDEDRVHAMAVQVLEDRLVLATPVVGDQDRAALGAPRDVDLVRAAFGRRVGVTDCTGGEAQLRERPCDLPGKPWSSGSEAASWVARRISFERQRDDA